MPSEASLAAKGQIAAARTVGKWPLVKLNIWEVATWENAAGGKALQKVPNRFF